MSNQASGCRNCDGKGWFNDTTYDRTGAMTRCSRCHGSGLPDDDVRRIISDAFTPFLLSKPKE